MKYITGKEATLSDVGRSRKFVVSRQLSMITSNLNFPVLRRQHVRRDTAIQKEGKGSPAYLQNGRMIGAVAVTTMEVADKLKELDQGHLYQEKLEERRRSKNLLKFDRKNRSQREN
jgi:hypothetical protein